MMGLPTTRAGRYEFRRQRYARKAYREWQHRYRPANGGYHDDHQGTHAGRPFLFVSGSPQKLLRDYIKYPEPGPAWPSGIITPFTVTYDGPHRTPHVHRDNPLSLPDHHERQADINYHHRRQMFKGRKIGKLNGHQRRSYQAWTNAMAFRREFGYIAWPAWDVDHRTPVQP